MSRSSSEGTLATPGGGWLIARPALTLLALDATGIGLMVAAVAQLADPDILLHVVWIVLALEAFVFGLRVATVRIAVATIFVIGYAAAANGDATSVAAEWTDLDLEEWPLMAVIACIVAIMADRVTNTGRRYAALYREASDRLLTAQEDERQRLAVDLHDGVGQTMTALTLTLDAAETSMGARARANAPGVPEVRRARDLAGIALDEVRGVALRLRPPRLREAGLVSAIEELAASAGVPVEFATDPTLQRPGLLPPDREVETYRIVQEALANATRHSHAGRIRVTVTRVDRALRIEVVDDGVGFEWPAARQGGLGLASMRERAAAVNGALHVQSRRGTGTVVRLDVPLTARVTAALAPEPLGVAAEVTVR
jgi:signal transduction histidine kinase